MNMAKGAGDLIMFFVPPRYLLYTSSLESKSWMLIGWRDTRCHTWHTIGCLILSSRFYLAAQFPVTVIFKFSRSDLAAPLIIFQSDPSCGVSKPAGGAWRRSYSGSDRRLPAVF